MYLKHAMPREFSVATLDAAGPGTEDTDAASVRADHCVPHASGIYYFEVEVRSCLAEKILVLGSPARIAVV